MLRSRSRGARSRGVPIPEPIVDPADGTDPEHEALLADSVGLALLVVLETLPPGRAARRSCCTTCSPSRSTTSRRSSIARRRRLGSWPAAPAAGCEPRRRLRDADLDGQREVVDAFLAAARDGDFEGWSPSSTPTSCSGPTRSGLPAGASFEVRGAEEVASRALTFSRPDLLQQPALINGAAGVVSMRDGKPFSVAGVTVRGGRIVEMDFLADPERLAALDLTVLDGEWRACARQRPATKVLRPITRGGWAPPGLRLPSMSVRRKS